jgi:hypothetical protein
MPIMNGYEACKKINKLFNKDQLFNHDESLIFTQGKQLIKMNQLQSNTPFLVA